MRLREIEYNLRDVSLLLEKFAADNVQNSHPQRFLIKPLQDIRKAIRILEGTGLFTSILEGLKNSSIFSNNLNSIEIIHDEFNKVQGWIDLLKLYVKNVLDSLEIVLPTELDPETVIYVKLPEIQDFDDLSKVLEKLKKAIQIPTNLQEIGGQVTITNFDTGSKWFEITLKSTIAAALIGSLAWAGAVISKKYLEVKVMEENLKRMELGSEHINAVVEANKKQLNLLIEAEAKYIHEIYFKNPNPEDLERLKLSIKCMSELIEAGTEIQPALLAPENVENLFPDYRNIMLIESKQKLIDK